MFCITLLADTWVSNQAYDATYNQLDHLPANRVGLLLGTSKYGSGGHVNSYYRNRLKAAFELYTSGKVEYILVSGDNGSIYYDEPTTMKKDLVRMGIPEDHIYLDYAGFRTLDSVVRSKVIFGQTSITIISQRFHNERALVLARMNGINAVAYNAPDVGFRFGLKTQLREKLARVKLIIDLVTLKKPKFGGPPVSIGG
ncbi:MAG: YdcF family protein [Flavobacteriales bacterium]|nr:YdcF family protein [Bacteroidota bacterium]MCB9241515.1 YdcF family protein [Flavobacteriales bacterium]